MTEAAGSGWMATTLARYETKVSLISPPVGGISVLVNADPRRWYLRISSTTAGGSTAAVGPGPVGAGTPTVAQTPLPLEVKFRDAPAMCTGSWICSNAGAIQFVVWEELYKGG